MGEENELTRLSQIIEHRLDGILLCWMKALDNQSWILKSTDSIGEQSVEETGDQKTSTTCVKARCHHFLDSLRKALERTNKLEVGAPEFREAIQYLSFTAGWLAGAGFPITDALALVHTLQETLRDEGLDLTFEPFFQSMVVVVAEAFSSSLDQKAQALYRDAMEKSQLVCEIHFHLPALFLVGDPDRQAVDDAIGRLMMLAMMREAKSVIVDLSGLIYPDEVTPGVCEILSEYSIASKVNILLSGLAPEKHQQFEVKEGIKVSCHETLAEAVAEVATAFDLDWSAVLSKNDSVR